MPQFKSPIQSWYDARIRLRNGGRLHTKQRKLLKIWERDKGICWLCRKPVPHPLQQWELLTPRTRPSLDHVHPLAALGSNAQENLRLAHQWCNSRKGSRCEAMALKLFREIIEEIDANIQT